MQLEWIARHTLHTAAPEWIRLQQVIGVYQSFTGILTGHIEHNTCIFIMMQLLGMLGFSVRTRNLENGVKWDPGTQLYIDIEKKTKKIHVPVKISAWIRKKFALSQTLCDILVF